MASYYYKKESKRNRSKEKCGKNNIKNNKKENNINIHNNNIDNYYNYRINMNNNKDIYYNEKEVINSSYITNKNKIYYNDNYPHGIINNLDNCSINTGLQIISCCNEIKPLLDRYKYEKSPLIRELIEFFNSNSNIKNPIKIINILSQIDEDFKIKGPKCSQNFIRILIKSINREIISLERNIIEKNPYYSPINNKEKEAYSKFIQNIFPESQFLSLFSGISKTILYGNCKYCHETIEDYMFNYYIDQILYLDEISFKCNFTDVLDLNLGRKNTISVPCPRCSKENNIEEKNKIIKLPHYLFFTLERNLNGKNKESIQPNERIDMRKLIDESLEIDDTQYELFAINIKLGKDSNSGHQICQIKRDGKFYEINDAFVKEINNPLSSSYYTGDSYGLFYRKISRYNY